MIAFEAWRSVAAAFTMGIFGSTHCIAMCGGVVSVLCGATGRCEATSRERSPYWLAYHAGRVVSYALFGALFGMLGTLSTGIFPVDGMRYLLRAFAAIGMLAVGLQLAGLPSLLAPLESVGARVWSKVAPWTRRHLPLRSPLHAFALGGVWGLMPCGLLYGALALAASTEAPLVGAATMAAFAAGTLPVMIAMSVFADHVARALGHAKVRRAAGILVLAFGVWSSAGLVEQLRAGGLSPVCCAHH